MKFLALLVSTMLGLSSAWGSSSETTILMTEYNRFHKLVTGLTPDGKIGDFMNYKKIDNYEVLWDLGPTPEDYSVIKFYNEHFDGTEDFFVTYYLSDDIIPGQTVIRRFVGPLAGSNWRNDTVDIVSGEYLGSQGAWEPLLSPEDLALLQKLEIQLIEP